MRTADDLDVTDALIWASETTGPLTRVTELSGGWTSTMLALVTGAGDELVLRLMTREPWRSHGAGLTTRESAIQQMLVRTPVPAPRSRALDAEGRRCGFPGHLMSLLPGRVDLDRVDKDSLDRLAHLLATIHDVSPTIEVRTYQSQRPRIDCQIRAHAAQPVVCRRRGAKRYKRSSRRSAGLLPGRCPVRGYQ